MISIRLKGGLGNQMFQYAFAKRVAHDRQAAFSLDLSDLLDRSKGDFVYRNYDLSIFSVQENFLLPPGFIRSLHRSKSSRVAKMVKAWAARGKQHVKEQHFHFQEALLQAGSPGQAVLYEGWFQSPKYFAGIETALRNDFSFRENVIQTSVALAARIKASNAVCLNVRRTDFLKVDTLNTTNRDYFLRGVEYLAERVEQPRFFIFSDDVDWCRENLQLEYPHEVVGHEHKGYKFGNYLQLMASCRHFIIPNSSYAWWAAWLSGAENQIVIAPERWFNGEVHDTSDLIPANWIRL